MNWFYRTVIILLASSAIGAAQGQGTDTDYIVGGEPAPEGSWPWQVRLFDGAEDWGGYCGGSLIADEWVLTAADCVYYDDGQLDLTIDVGYGSVYRSKLVRVAATKVIPHPAYDGTSIENDVALIRLSAPVTPSRWIALSGPKDEASLLKTTSQATVTGWGALWDFKVFADKTADGLHGQFLLQQILDRKDLRFPEQMHQVDIDVIDGGACRQVYDQLEIDAKFLPDKMLCAGAIQGSRSSCHGDSGGPLVVAGEDGYLQVGIVSWGIQCGHPQFPSVYTRISSYADWIAEQMKAN
jgi:secreted trypsin-like serine protease